MRPEHALGLLLNASESLLTQEISVVEWAVQWECCARDLASRDWPALQPAQECLEQLRVFATTGGLTPLDHGLAQLRQLVAEWDHWWWVAERSGSPWPPPQRAAQALHVTRQAGRSRISWQCPECAWSITWDVETAAWQVLEWPGVLECPLCSTASNDGHHDGESPRIECER